MSKEKTVKKEVGIIGQMYENRTGKTKKVGVLESREEKYRTLLMRAPDGSTFNITYSTFNSNWRKYSGEQIAQTSTQVKEEKAKTEKKKTEAKKTVEKKTNEVKLTTEDKVKRIRSIEEVISSTVVSRGINIKTNFNTKGGVVVRYKKRTVFEVWDAYKVNKISFRMKEDFDKFVSTSAEKEILNDTGNNIRYRVDPDKFEATLSEMLDAADKFIQSKTENEKTKNKEEK